MAFNKFMHPRNRYKDNKPNFDELASKYPDFSRHVIRNQAGRATLDFRDPEALRALTCTLLKDDFGLEVELPLDRLIPTLSLRLNYIHWIEDLLAASSHDKGQVNGIDIGCGPSCIYPLLGSRMNGWQFQASEVDGLAIYYANENIKRNGLSDKVTVVETEEGCMFEHILKDASSSRQRPYHFTMCNPPFFGNSLEAQGIMGSRSMSRPEPKTVSTAAELEMIAEGGEVEFVSRMIAESLSLRKQVVWYTSMLGKKSSLPLVKEELRRNKILNVTHTEFCQGRTMRWGIAWSFYDDIQLPDRNLMRRKGSDRCPPFIVPVPDAYIQRVSQAGQGGGLQNKIQAVARAMQSMMEALKMDVERKPTSKWCGKFVLTATRNTWSHQRRKRRRDKQRASTSPSGIKGPSSSSTQPRSSGSSSGSDTDEHCAEPQAKLLKRDSEMGEPRTNPSGDFNLSLPSSSPSLSREFSRLVGESASEQEAPDRTRPDTSKDCQTSYMEVVPTKTSSEIKPLIDSPSVNTSVVEPQHTDFTPKPTEPSIHTKDLPGESKERSVKEGFPLEINLDVKLGEKRAIVVEAKVMDSSRRYLLHQVVQYVKNQMNLR